MGVLGGWAFSYERGTPVHTQRFQSRKGEAFSKAMRGSTHLVPAQGQQQGYIAHEKHPPPRGIKKDYVGSYGGPRREMFLLYGFRRGVFLVSKVPL
jgi:hypothetical protein